MSITENVAAAVTAMKAFGSAYTTALATRDTATTADSASTVNSKTYSEILSSAEAGTVAHAATSGLGHITTAGLTDTKTEFETRISGMVPLSALPLSRYGNSSKVPVEVSGSFEGATGNYDSRWMALNIEDDGTLTILRNGTDGGTKGVYYAYSSNALSLAQTTPQKTTRKYKPSFWSDAMTAYCVMKSSEGVLVTKVYDSSISDYVYSIVLTKGTLDDDSHDGCFISSGDWITPSRGHVEPILCGDYLYFITPYITELSNPVKLRVHRIPATSITAGNYLIPEEVTGWVTTGFTQSYSGDMIQVAGCSWSASASDDPLLLLASSTNMGGEMWMDCGMFTFIGYDNDDGVNKLRILCCGDTWWANSLTGAAIRPFVAFSLIVDLDAKTAVVESGQTTATVTQDSSLSPYFSDAGTIYSRSGNDVQGFFPGGNNYTSYHYHEKTGTIIFVVDTNLVDNGYWLAAYRFSDGSELSKYAASRWDRVVKSGNVIGFSPKYGSAIGGKIMNGYFLPNSYAMFYCMGANSSGDTNTGHVRAKISGTYNEYSYTSINNGTLLGYPPSSTRSFINDNGLSLTYPTYNPILSYTTIGGVCRLFGTNYIEGGVTSGIYYEMDENFTGSALSSITDAALASAKSQMVSLLGLSASTLVTTKVNVVVVPEDVGMESYVVLQWFDTSKAVKLAVGVIEAITVETNNAVTALTISRVSAASTVHSSANEMAFDYSGATLAGAAQIHKGANGYYIGAQTPFRIGWTGNGGSTRYSFYASTDGTIDTDTFSAGLTYLFYSPHGFIGIPGVGFGYMSSDFGVSDNQTKLIFQKFPDSKAGFVAKTVESNTVIQGQQVASGWVVYFTTSVPIFMNGAYGTVSAWSCDLATTFGNPANKTLYVYVNESNGSFSYEINADQLEETTTRMFVGTITCGETSISSIDVDKVSRIGVYRVSTTPIGSSMPATAGTAGTLSGELNWS